MRVVKTLTITYLFGEEFDHQKARAVAEAEGMDMKYAVSSFGAVRDGFEVKFTEAWRR